MWRLELTEVKENNALNNSNIFVKKLKERSLIFSSTAIALVLSACGRETRSTTEVPLADETSNVPTAFDDKLVGSDDLDTFTALAGDDEIYGFGGNDQIIAGTGNDTIYGGDGDDNIHQALAMTKYMVRVEMIPFIFQREQILKMVAKVQTQLYLAQTRLHCQLQ